MHLLFLREQKELLDTRSLISTTSTSSSVDVRTELSANLVVTGNFDNILWMYIEKKCTLNTASNYRLSIKEFLKIFYL